MNKPTEETASNLLKALQPSQGASLTAKKALFVMERGFQVSGLILVHPETHERILIEASAVVTLENEKMWELFHPSETTITDEQIAHIEKTRRCPRAFCQPREGQAFPMEIPLVTETELYYRCKRCETVWVVQKRKLITHLYEPHPE